MAEKILYYGEQVDVPYMIAALKLAKKKLPNSPTGLCGVLTEFDRNYILGAGEREYLLYWIKKMLTLKQQCWTLEEWLWEQGYPDLRKEYPSPECTRVRQRWVDYMIAELQKVLDTP